MLRYNKYIIKQLVHSTLLVTFSLVSIVWLTQALRFVEFIVNQGISIAMFVQLTAFLLPSLLLMVLPPALFCAVVFSYNKLSSDSELLVMQAMGLSRMRLAFPAIVVAGVVTAIGYVIALYIQPVSYRDFREMQSTLKNNYVSLLVQEGVFSNPVDGLTVFVRERDASGELHGILVHDNREAEKSITMMAESGRLVETPQGPRFLLANGNRQEMNDGRLSLLNFDSYTLDISFYTGAMGDRKQDAQELFLPELLAENEQLSPTENSKRHAEAHQRIIWPAYSLTLTLVAVAFLFSGEFNRRGQWQRITISSVVAAGLLFAAVGIRGGMAANNLLIPFAYIILIAPALASLWILRDRAKIIVRKL